MGVAHTHTPIFPYSHTPILKDVLIEIDNLSKDYPSGDTVVHALRDVTVGIEAGDFVAIMGPSGSGKSTFLNMLGCLDRPTTGGYKLNGESIRELSDNDLAELRNRYLS